MELPDFNISFWILQTVAMLVTCLLIPGLKVDGPIPALATVICLAFINSHVWNTALFFKIPDSFTNQTLLLLVTNGIIFWLVVKILPGIEISGVLPALAAPVIFTLCSVAISTYAPQVDWPAVGKSVLHYLSELRTYFEQSSVTNTQVTK